jgi:hypothetical protein
MEIPACASALPGRWRDGDRQPQSAHAYVHIAHDCQLGSHIIMTNSAATQALEAIEPRGLKSELVRFLVEFMKMSEGWPINGASSV